MGNRGPAAKPTQLALLHGDKASRINTAAPVAPEGFPEPPYTLSKEAREVWNHTVEALRVMKLTSPADRDVLVAYVEAVVTHRAITRALKRTDGPVILNAKGDALVKNPLIAMQRDAATLIRVLAREFGLTPSARSDITTGGGKGNNGAGLERYFS